MAYPARRFKHHKRVEREEPGHMSRIHTPRMLVALDSPSNIPPDTPRRVYAWCHRTLSWHAIDSSVNRRVVIDVQICKTRIDVEGLPRLSGGNGPWSWDICTCLGGLAVAWAKYDVKMNMLHASNERVMRFPFRLTKDDFPSLSLGALSSPRYGTENLVARLDDRNKGDVEERSSLQLVWDLPNGVWVLSRREWANFEQSIIKERKKKCELRWAILRVAS